MGWEASGWFISQAIILFVWLISHQPAVLLSQNKQATSNQSAVLLSQNKTAPAISHQPNEQAACMTKHLECNVGSRTAAVQLTKNLIEEELFYIEEERALTG
jgi:hypothetical protein